MNPVQVELAEQRSSQHPISTVGRGAVLQKSSFMKHCKIAITRLECDILEMVTLFAYGTAALAEIFGCFAFWAWLRLGRSVWWLVPGGLSLALFAWALTWVESEAAGRAYAAYGGVYIAASLGWLWLVEGVRPDRWDALGALTCLVGAAIIVGAPRP